MPNEVEYDTNELEQRLKAELLQSLKSELSSLSARLTKIESEPKPKPNPSVPSHTHFEIEKELRRLDARISQVAKETGGWITKILKQLPD